MSYLLGRKHGFVPVLQQQGAVPPSHRPVLSADSCSSLGLGFTTQFPLPAAPPAQPQGAFAPQEEALQRSKAPEADPLQLPVLPAAGQSLGCRAGVRTLPAEPAAVKHFTAAKGTAESGWRGLRLPHPSCVRSHRKP